MRSRRIKDEGVGYYHVVSRVVDRQMILTDVEKESFRKILRAVEGFSGCRVLTYAVLTNHFHALLYVPEEQSLADAELLARLRFLYGPREVAAIAGQLRALRAAGDNRAAEAIRAPYLRRMFDLSEFVKDVKQRFSQSYNRRHGRKGTLWEERFKSVLLEGNVGTLSTVSAYIDLNPMRAGIVDDPKDYRFSGYGEAVAGSLGARRGIRAIMSTVARPATWGQAASGYRKLLYAAAAPRGLAENGAPTRRSFTAAQVEAVEKADGKLPAAALLRCRVRYFTDGAILGTQGFVNDAFSRHREHFGAKRRSGARAMVGDWGDLCAARRLRLDVISVPVPS